MATKIYVASSWRNQDQPGVVAALREDGHEVYDFRNPPSSTGFHWSAIDPNWRSWTSEEFLNGLSHTIAEAGFKSDFDAMKWADVFVLVEPCGRSAHLEAGWAAGAGKPVFVLLHSGDEPELMLKMVEPNGELFTSLDVLRETLRTK